jgi:carbon storage regulator
MLVITRKPGEEVVIGSNITVEVLTVDGGCVRLGITAPPDVPVWRKELLEQQPERQIEGKT